MTRLLPPMSALRAFEAAARLGSIRRAGAELSLSHTVVSRHLRKLETLVGTKLLLVGPAGVALTSEGARYRDAIIDALDRIASASEELRPTAAHGEIRIWCAAGLATRWLTRRLPDLERALAPIEIVLTPTDRQPDFARREADVAITYGAPARVGLQAEVLLHARMFPVASPTYLALHGPISTLAELVAQPLLHEESKEQWRTWFEAAGLSAVPRLSGPRLRYADVTIEAALQGQGIALANALLVGSELAEHRLVECLDSHVLLEPYVIQAASARWSDTAVRRFRTWLRRQLA